MHADAHSFATDREREIAARLERVCAHLGDAEFRDLIRAIAATEERFRRIERESLPPVGPDRPDFR